MMKKKYVKAKIILVRHQKKEKCLKVFSDELR